MTQLRNVNIQSQDSFSIDAFGRWRVSNPITLFDSKNIFDDDGLAASVENQPLFWDNAEISGGSTSTAYEANESTQTISVALNTAGVRARQTKMRFNYQPGKSHLAIVTFNLESLDSGVTKCVGYFDEKNGIFLEGDGSSMSFVRRTYTSGSAVDNSVAQASWNIDTMDGSGTSGITLDFTTTQILFIDMEWLGVGRVRAGFVIDGKIYYAHEFLNTNSLTIPYMQTPNLPIRYEIENDGTGAASTLNCICSTVISEGGSSDLGVTRYASTSTHVDADAAATTYAVVGIKLKSEYIGATINILSVSLIEVASSKDLEWVLYLNPTVAGTFTYADETNSAVQTAKGATANTVTGGTRLSGGFFNSDRGGVAGNVNEGIPSALTLGSTISGTVDEIVLCVKNLTGVTNSDVYGSLTWRELV